jgi:hypothetical protein
MVCLRRGKCAWSFGRPTISCSRKYVPKVIPLQDEALPLVEINASLGGGTVRMVLRYLVFEAVTVFGGRLGCGYPQHVTKLAEKETQVLLYLAPLRGLFHSGI